MNPSFISDDLSEISLGDLFHPNSPLPPPPPPGAPDHLSYMPGSNHQPPSVGQVLKDDMENFQDLYPSLVLSPGQWRPPMDEDEDPAKTMIQEEEAMGKEELFCDDPITSAGLWMNNWDGFSQVENGFSGVENGHGILTDVGFPWTQSGGTVTVQMDDDDGAKVICGSNDAKVKFKEKVITSSKTETKKKNGVAKVGSRVSGGCGGRRRAGAASSASGPGASSASSAAAVAAAAADEERRRRRQESNRRAAERYRTKLKASAVDVASEHNRLMEVNERLSLENDRLRRHLSLIFASVQHHQQFCSAPFLLSQEQFHLETTFLTSDASTSSQIGSNSAEPFQAQFPSGGSERGTTVAAAELLVQNRSGPVNTSYHGDHHEPHQIGSVPFLVVEPFGGDVIEEPQLDCFGQLRVLGLYTNSSAIN